jgi:pseudaminic acid synthase
MAIHIAGRPVGEDHPPFIIAEVSGNHNGSLDRALAIVDAIAQAGADAVKLQTYTPETMTLDVDSGDFRITDPASPWVGRKLHDLYTEAQTPYDWHEPLFARARARGLIAFSTPFDPTAVDFLVELGAPAIKIASFENTDVRLIAHAARTGLPVIISTGLASIAEIDQALQAARGAGAHEIALLKCTSAYPAPTTRSNLQTIPHMRAGFGVPVGLSDHTPGIGAAVGSVALGACIIEKHVTLKRSDGGVDAAFSLEPDELAALVVESRRAWEARGSVSYGPSEEERGSLVFRRSLYVARDIAAGDIFDETNVRIVRPGHGLSPSHYGEVLGRCARVPLAKGTALRWHHVT